MLTLKIADIVKIRWLLCCAPKNKKETLFVFAISHSTHLNESRLNRLDAIYRRHRHGEAL